MKTAVTVGILLLASLLSLSVGPSAVSAEPVSLTLSPTEGPPGTSVLVTGGGFPPGSPVDIVWHTMEGNRVSGSGFTEVG